MNNFKNDLKTFYKRLLMKKKKNIYLTVIVLLFVHTMAVNAQNAKPVNVVTTAVPFLRISSDARAGGMGDIGLATSPDANAAFWNLGKISFNEKRGGIAVNYAPWLNEWSNDMYLASVSGFQKLDEKQTIHASMRYFSLGDLQFADNNGVHLQSFHPREWGVDIGYSRKLSEKMGVGIGLKYIYSNLANKGTNGNDYKAGHAVAADLGLYYDAKKASGNGWSFGAALSNLGSKIDYSNDATQKDYIPANLGLGTVYTRVFNEQNKISFGLDINKLLVPTPPAVGDSAALAVYRNKGVVSSWFSSFGDAQGGFSEELKEFQVSIGSEYWYNNQFAIRAGYFYESPSKGNRKFFTVGAGVKYNIFTLNFSYLVLSGNDFNRSPLANTLRFGLIMNSK